MAERVLLLIGSIGPFGYLPASGTVTVAAVGIPLAWLMRVHFAWSVGVYLGVVIAFSLLSVWIHDAGDRALGEKDSRRLVWDELAGFFIAVAIMPWTWQMVMVAFFLERAIDIVKVPPANIIENNIAGGLGVVGDDIVAGVYTLLLLWALEHFQPLQGVLGLA